MSSLFNQDRGFWRFLNKASDIVILNFITVLLSLPIFTIGPAYTALYYTTVKTVKKGRGYLIKNYFHSFTQNLFQGTLAWMILLVCFLSSAYMVYINYKPAVAGGMPQLLFWLGLLICLMILCTMIYCFPVLSRFDFSTKVLLSFSYILSFRYFTYTLGILCVLAIVGFIGYFIPPLAIICLPALFVYGISSMIERIFRVYMPKVEANNAENSEEDGDSTPVVDENGNYKDQWYYD